MVGSGLELAFLNASREKILRGSVCNINFSNDTEGPF
jgi:hypothetical protein